MTLKHSFVSPVTDGGDASLVGPDEWNANHSIVTDLSPDADDSASLGTASKQWSDIYLGADGSINWLGANNGTGRKVILQDGKWLWTTSFGNTQFVLEAASSQAPRIQVGYTGDSFARINFGIGSSGVPNFQFGPGNADRDTTMIRAAAATWQVGIDDSAAPVAQTLQTQSVVAGTSNTAGADWTFVGSKGTGTGAGGSFIWKTAPAGTSGTSQNSATQQASLDSNGLLTLTDFFQWGGGKRSSSNFSKTNDTTLANVTDLSVNVRAGRTYSFRAVLFVSSGGSTGGLKAAIGGTATATNIIYSGHCKDTGGTGTHGYAQSSSLGGAVASSITTSDTTTIFIDGTITVNAAGTLTVQAAQNTSNGTATVFARGSYFLVYDVP